MTQCWYPEDSEASQRDLAPHTFLPNGPEEVIFEIDVFERVLAKERFVDVAEARTAASQPLQLARGDYNRNRLAPASKLDFQTGLGFVNDSGKIGTGLGDGIPFRHDLSENSIMGSEMEKLPDWEQLPAAERHLQYLIPGAVLVGGTAAAIHDGHRVSMDADHVVDDLRERFDEVLATLEAVAGWQTERIQRPVLILGQLDGILTGIRQLRRTRPLGTEQVGGLRVPTLAEMARIKAWLLATRHTVRDYLDTVVLFERLGPDGTVAALRSFDEIYRQANGASPLAEVSERLAAAQPRDLADIDLAGYRGLRPPWNDWDHVTSCGRRWAAIVARVALEDVP